MHVSSGAPAPHDPLRQGLELFTQAEKIDRAAPGCLRAEPRMAFAATLKDPGLFADAENMQSPHSVAGRSASGRIENALAYHPAIVAKAQALTSAGQDR